jgi:hypothetical protein
MSNEPDEALETDEVIHEARALAASCDKARVQVDIGELQMSFTDKGVWVRAWLFVPTDKGKIS